MPPGGFLILLGAFVAALGILQLRFPTGFANFYYSLAWPAIGTRAADRVHTPRSTRWAGIVFVVVGVAIIALGIAGLIGVIELHYYSPPAVGS
jgi:hypothetical protein